LENNQHAVRQQFGQSATDYRDEPLFAEGSDLNWMVESMEFSGAERLLDIGTGAGHTCLAFAPLLAECVGLDVTPEMVQVATGLAADKGMTNVRFLQAEAEHLPFADDTFDVVTCRFAAHHFANVEQAMREVSRVLRPGGTFLLIDHYAPEPPELDEFVNTLDQLRDPSHVREYSLAQWQSYFQQNELSFAEVRHWDLKLEFANWVKRAKTPLHVQEQLAQFLGGASEACKETFQLEIVDGQPQTFCLKCAFLRGSTAVV